MLKEILDYLEKAEGIHIHRHSSEDDITLPYGLYKQYDSKLYKYILEIAELNGITKPSKEWNSKDIDLVNSLIDAGKDGIRIYAEEFYFKFLENAHLKLFPKPCQVAMYSMYVHSPKNALKAVQRSIINMVKSDRLGLLLNEVSIEDGSWGSKTASSLRYILKQKSEEFHFYLEEAMLGNMTDIYIEIWKRDPSKYSEHLNGWKNRMAKLKAMR